MDSPVQSSIFAEDFSEEPWWWDAAPRPSGPGELPELPRAPESFPSRADVVVIGSGYTGLSAALHLARAGREVLVLEAGAPGHGASTRNAGFVGKTLKHSFSSLAERHGMDYAVRVYGEMQAAYDSVFELVETEGIDCHLKRCGRFMGALAPGQYEDMARELELRASHLDDSFEMVPRSEQHREIGSTAYHGGALIHNLASIHPALYHQGLLAAAERAGVRVIGDSAVLGTRTGRDGVDICTHWGVLSARDVVAATNGYTTSATGWLRRRLVPFQGYMVATERLSEARLRELIPNDRTFHDYNNNLTYIRQAPDQPRLLLGGLTGPKVASLRAKASALHERILRIFPQLEGVRLSRVWTGACAGTFDLWPHIGSHRGVHYAGGYCFAGLPMATYLGARLSARITGVGETRTVFAERPLKGHPLYFGRPWFLGWYMRWYDYQDRRQLPLGQTN